MTGSPLRRDMESILRAALEAVDPVRLVTEALADDPELARWAPEIAAAPTAATGPGGSGADGGGRTVLLAVGKAAMGMTRGAVRVLGDVLDGGMVLVPHPDGRRPDPPPRPQWLPTRFRLRSGGHPLPDRHGMEAAREAMELVEELGPADRLLVLISGGGSALLTCPRPGLSPEALRVATRVLLEAGLTIHDLNRVRILLEELKGGGLARRAAPARVLGLLLSDVVGDEPAVIASGPLTPSEPTPREVEGMLRRRGVWEALPDPVREMLHRPIEADRTGAVGTPVVRVVGRGETALTAALGAGRGLGYTPRVLTTRLQGEARRAGRGLARVGRAVQDGLAPPGPPACLLASGETTVEVRGDGRGGRNQEVALGAAEGLAGGTGILVASLGTDGVDGPTDAAGAVADGSTVARARAAGLDVSAALRNNDAYPLLDALGDLIRTGPTGTNVADLMVVLVSEADNPDRG